MATGHPELSWNLKRIVTTPFRTIAGKKRHDPHRAAKDGVMAFTKRMTMKKYLQWLRRQLARVTSHKEHSIHLPEILKALEHVSSFDLWRLTQAIDGMLKDPMRARAVLSRLRTNQDIVYFDTCENKEIKATVVEIRRTHVLVKNHDDGKHWQIPFYMLEVESSANDDGTRCSKIDRSNLKVGDPVGFLSRSDQEICGTVTKLNPKSAEVALPTGERWRVHYHALFHVSEAKCQNDESKISTEMIENPETGGLKHG